MPFRSYALGAELACSGLWDFKRIFSSARCCGHVKRALIYDYAHRCMNPAVHFRAERKRIGVLTQHKPPPPERMAASELTRQQGNDRAMRRTPTRALGLEELHDGPVTRGGRYTGFVTVHGPWAAHSVSQVLLVANRILATFSGFLYGWQAVVIRSSCVARDSSKSHVSHQVSACAIMSAVQKDRAICSQRASGGHRMLAPHFGAEFQLRAAALPRCVARAFSFVRIPLPGGRGGDSFYRGTIRPDAEMMLATGRLTGTVVAERLASSPPTKANRIQSPSSFQDFRMWKSCRMMSLVKAFSRGSPVPLALSFQRCTILTSITPVGSQDLVVKSHPNLFSPFIRTSANMEGAAYIIPGTLGPPLPPKPSHDDTRGNNTLVTGAGNKNIKTSRFGGASGSYSVILVSIPRASGREHTASSTDRARQGAKPKWTRPGAWGRASGIFRCRVFPEKARRSSPGGRGQVDSALGPLHARVCCPVCHNGQLKPGSASCSEPDGRSATARTGRFEPLYVPGPASARVCRPMPLHVSSELNGPWSLPRVPGLTSCSHGAETRARVASVISAEFGKAVSTQQTRKVRTGIGLVKDSRLTPAR
ncbi:hypothetical protein PR048_023251 [Dryococelus australis]|uniref:Uncharacterized protein n=1 Tax=Dryococelus australis TaxID=614101 RepID=A0ABQ9GTI6_9NEOP|nr:hypothetical protein PR048_023251 [Dryococelus australis]